MVTSKMDYFTFGMLLQSYTVAYQMMYEIDKDTFKYEATHKIEDLTYNSKSKIEIYDSFVKARFNVDVRKWEF